MKDIWSPIPKATVLDFACIIPSRVVPLTIICVLCAIHLSIPTAILLALIAWELTDSLISTVRIVRLARKSAEDIGVNFAQFVTMLKHCELGFRMDKVLCDYISKQEEKENAATTEDS